MTTEHQRDIEKRLPSGENLLLDYIHKLERHRRGRRAVIIRLSLLQPVNRREHHIRIALNSFDPMIKALKGQIFSLSSSDIIFIFKDAAIDDVEAAVVKVRFLFSDDPALADENLPGKMPFVDWYLLERDYDALLHMAQRMVSEDHQRRTQDFTKGYASQLTPRMARRGDPLTPSILAKLEENLARADLANHLRRQAICAIVGKSPPQPIFSELFVSIADLRETLLPNVNLASSPWLFQQLTETLDRRVLSLLNKHDDRTVFGDVAINLNVQTLLSPDFLVFDDNVKAAMRGTLVLELQKVDVFADLGAFLFARDFVHDRTYRICLDGVNIDALPFIDRERLGVDMVKLVWDPVMLNGVLPNGQSLEDYVKKCGTSRVILCRCDAQDAVEFGQKIGITLFQGRHVEALHAAELQKSKGIRGRRR
jgi:hypothetical protein